MRRAESPTALLRPILTPSERRPTLDINEWQNFYRHYDNAHYADPGGRIGGKAVRTTECPDLTAALQ
jgi:hypothetical protein